jgi:hypothetical protein
MGPLSAECAAACTTRAAYQRGSFAPEHRGDWEVSKATGAGWADVPHRNHGSARLTSDARA